METSLSAGIKGAGEPNLAALEANEVRLKQCSPINATVPCNSRMMGPHNVWRGLLTLFSCSHYLGEPCSYQQHTEHPPVRIFIVLATAEGVQKPLRGIDTEHEPILEYIDSADRFPRLLAMRFTRTPRLCNKQLLGKR